MAGIGGLWLRTAQGTAEDLAQQVMGEGSDRAQQQLADYLANAERINQLNAGAIAAGDLSSADPNALTRRFWQQRFLFNSVCGSAIFWADLQGEFVGLGFQRVRDRWEIGRSGAATGGVFFSFAPNAQGNATTLLDRLDPYDPRLRPWYQRAVQTQAPVWSPVFEDWSQRDLKIAHSHPIDNDAGELIGIVGVDCLFSNLSGFLAQQSLAESGAVVVMERSGELIATSTGQAVLGSNNG